MMHRLCLTAFLVVMPVLAPADTARGGLALTVTPLQADTLDRLRWQARPVIVLGEAGQVAAQIVALQTRAPALAERDVVVLTDGPGAGALPSGPGFRILLIGKDGGVKLQRDGLVPPQEIIDLIDSMPMRRREAE